MNKEAYQINVGRFQRRYWGKLYLFEVPLDIVQEGSLALKPNALTVLLILLQKAKAKQSRNKGIVEVKITQKALIERSGFSKNTVTKAVQELEQKKFLQRVRETTSLGEFGANVYIICNPSNATPLRSTSSNIFIRTGIRYMRIPRCVVTESTAQWSLAKMNPSEVRMYVALCWLANKYSDHQFTTSVSEMRELTGFSTAATMQSALDGLESNGLALVSPEQSEVHIHLLDPYSGEPLHNETLDPTVDPANYFSADARGRESRLNLNDSNPEQIRNLVISCLPSDRAEVINQNNGDFKISCPFHADDTPSCSVSPTKRVFYCFGCNQKGHLTALLQKLTGESKGEVIRRIGQTQGKDVRYHNPDANAEAIYPYRDKNGKLVKQVLRYPDKEFRQRRPSRGDWIWDTKGVKPLLYNLPELEFAATCILCEGEKDCETLKKLQLTDLHGGEIVATTPGGADSWSDELADSLLHKKVILMPDKDEAGTRFASNVIASLQERRIEYRLVTLDDVRAKDVTEFIELGYGRTELGDRIGTDWMSDGTQSPQAADDVMVTI